ncbi:MAG: hypothetical protein AB9897_03350 [Anaerolineaceae bacterium]
MCKGLLKGLSSREDELHSYLRKILEVTTFRVNPQISEDEKKRVIDCITKIIDTDNNEILYFEGHEDLFNSTFQCLVPYGPNILLPLYGYEAICYRGPTYFDAPFFEILCARIVEHCAPDSYQVIKDASTKGLDEIALEYTRRLEMGTAMIERIQERYQLLIQWTRNKI